MVGLLLGVVLAASLNPLGGAVLVDSQDGPVVHVWSPDYYQPVDQPSVTTTEFQPLLLTHPGEQLRVCVRSAHKRSGFLSVSIRAAVEDVIEIPHGKRMRTRCGFFTVQVTPPVLGTVRVEEGTYVGVDTDWPVHGWIKNISLRLVR